MQLISEPISNTFFKGNYIACSSRGQHHIRCNVENQDRFGVFSTNDLIAFVVADGLGSCARSGAGAAVAVDVVKKCCEEGLFLTDCNGLAQRMIQRWKECVGISQNDYSTTLRFVVVAPNSIIYGSIGDGMTLVNNGKLVLKTADKWFANCTEALCEHPAPLQIEVQTLSEDEISVLLMTDGISDSIQRGKEFYLLDYISMLTDKDDSSEISDWIEEMASVSGDDKTLIAARLVKKV